MKITGGHFIYLEFETTCPLCKRVLTYKMSGASVRDFPKRLKFSCKQLACTREWWKVLDLQLNPVEYDSVRSKGWSRKIRDFFFG